VAATCTHPLDVTKVSVLLFMIVNTFTHLNYSRMQTLESVPEAKRPSTLRIISRSISESGFRSFYAGLSASLLRQMSYSLVRLGVYEKIKAKLSKEGNSTPTRLLLAACLAGALGGVAGNPAGEIMWQPSTHTHKCTDIMLVRMTSDLVRPQEKRYNYSNAMAGLASLVREEGIQGLARGLGTNAVSWQFTCCVFFIFISNNLHKFRAILMNVSWFYFSNYILTVFSGISSGIVRTPLFPGMLNVNMSLVTIILRQPFFATHCQSSIVNSKTHYQSIWCLAALPRCLPRVITRSSPIIHTVVDAMKFTAVCSPADVLRSRLMAAVCRLVMLLVLDSDSPSSPATLLLSKFLENLCKKKVLDSCSRVGHRHSLDWVQILFWCLFSMRYFVISMPLRACWLLLSNWRRHGEEAYRAIYISGLI